MNLSFENQVALVTGASRGIGKAIAHSLGSNGATLIGTATSQTGVAMIEEMFEKDNIAGLAHILDVSSDESVRDFFKFLASKKIFPSILVNNAGITRDNLMLRMKSAEWEEVINTNLTSIYRITKASLRGMIKAQYGRIINITSVVGLSGNAGQVNYSSAKAGIIGFTKSLAKEIGTRGITVNSIAPGFIMSDMTGELTSEQRTNITKQIPLGRLGNANDVANVVIFLASDAAGYITGETINVSGGIYM